MSASRSLLQCSRLSGTLTVPVAVRSATVVLPVKVVGPVVLAFAFNDVCRPLTFAMLRALSGTLTVPVAVRLATVVVPVKVVGPVVLAFAFNEVCKPLTFAMLRALSGTFTAPVAVRLATVVVPVKVGPARFAFKSRAACVSAAVMLERTEGYSTWLMGRTGYRVPLWVQVSVEMGVAVYLDGRP